MKILVIDDSSEQRKYAKKSLSEHKVTIVDGWNSGEEAINQGGWDMVLTDLSMPGAEDGQGSCDRFDHIGKPTPYGFVLALLAVKAGVPKVAIVSNGNDDANHHTRPIFWAADSIDGTIIPGKLWAFTGYACPHLPYNREAEHLCRITDWAGIVVQMV